MIRRRNLTLLTPDCPVILLKKEYLNVAKKVEETELSMIELHQEQLREARIKLMGVLEAYIVGEGLSVREAVLMFASSNMWDAKKAARYLQLMSEAASPFKNAKLYREFQGD
jgi:hypothetical protein